MAFSSGYVLDACNWILQHMQVMCRPNHKFINTPTDWCDKVE